MRILHTGQLYEPSVGGAQEVMKRISEGLAELGHEVTVAAAADKDRKHKRLKGVKVLEFNLSGNSVRGIKGDPRDYIDLLINGDFDIVMNYAAQQWATDVALPILDRIKAKKVFAPCGFSGLFQPEYKEYFNQMKSRIKQYDACVYHSNDYRDINFAKASGADNDVFIPNGASAKEFGEKSKIDIRSRLKIPSDHFLILHVGSHTGLKGHREAIQMFKAANIKQACLLIVANDFGGGCAGQCRRSEKIMAVNPHARMVDKRIIVRSLTREETVAAYHEADLFLFPSYVECSPIVLFEAMASKTPFLSTDVGNAKEIIEWSQSGRLLAGFDSASGGIKADVGESALILEMLVKNPEARERLARSGHEAWIKHFTWEKITESFENLYKTLLAEREIKRDPFISRHIQTS